MVKRLSQKCSMTLRLYDFPFRMAHQRLTEVVQVPHDLAELGVKFVLRRRYHTHYIFMLGDRKMNWLTANKLCHTKLNAKAFTYSSHQKLTEVFGILHGKTEVVFTEFQERNQA